MPPDNVALARRVYDAMNARDLPAFLALFDPELEAVPRSAFLEGHFHGHAGARRWWEGILNLIPDFACEIVEVRAAGDVTLGRIHVSGHGGESGTPFDETIWQVARWRDGRAVWWGTFNTSEEAHAAAGLQARPG